MWIGARSLGNGSNQGRSGYLNQPYLGTTERGAMNIEPSALVERIAWCEEHGWQPMVHANGDATTQLGGEAYSKALGGRPGKDLRHRIEHCSLVDDGVFETMASVGVSPSFLINHVYFWGQTSGTTCWAPSGPSSLTARPGPPGPGSGSRCTRTTT